jgi:hypothetical protein
MKHFYVGDFGAIANGDEAVLRFVFLHRKKVNFSVRCEKKK